MVEAGQERAAQRQVDLGREAEAGHGLESLRQDAEDRVRLAVDDQRAADRAPIRAEAGAPEAVADDHHARIALGGRFDGGEAAAEGHRHAEDVEEVGRDEHRHHRVGAIALADVDRSFDVVAGQPVEDAGLVESPPVGVGDVTAAVEPDVDQRVDVARRGPGEQQLRGEVDDERRGARAGANRRGGGEHDQRLGERGRADRSAGPAIRLCAIATRRVSRHCSSTSATRAEVAAGGEAGILGAQAAGDVFACRFVEVQRDLGRAAPCRRGGAAGGRAGGARDVRWCAACHASPSRTTRPIAPDSRSQLSSSRASCFFPAGVSA